MNRILLLLTLVAVSGIGSAFGQTAVPAEEAAVAAEPVDHVQAALTAIEAKNFPVAEDHLAAISDPVGQLYVWASLKRAKGDAEGAVQMLARLIVMHPNDEQWIAKSELLSAEIYVELGLLNAAEVTARQVQVLHAGTDSAQQAAALSVEIEKLKNETEGSVE